ncbi:hypothetical protein RUND412_006356 [Rhizina undulata]
MVVVVVATIVALAWMCYRASTLLNIPIPTLVKLLGLDLPAPPRVSLHGIASDTITLHWSLPERAGSVAKHIIQINGINVGESEKRGETSVTVTGLNPDHLYNVRVIAANSHNFQAPGQLIRLRTRSKSQVSNDNGGGFNPKGDSSDDSPSIQPHTPILEPPSPQAHSTHHHHHNNHPRRTARDRRSSPATLEQQNHATSSRPEDCHTVESLTTDLEAVRRDIDDAETQLAHTEEEFKTSESVLRTELDLLKEKKNEEDSVRQKLRAETRTLEEGKRVAEALKTKTEKVLRAKEDEIKRMREDSRRWDEERMAALVKVDELLKKVEESKDHAQNTERNLSDEMKEAQNSIAAMEEEIRSFVTAIKAYEAQRDKWKMQDDAEAKRMREDEEREREWKERQRALEMHYFQVYNAYQAAEAEFMKAEEALRSCSSRRGSGAGDAGMPHKKNKQRRNRNRKSRTQTVSSAMNPFSSPDPRFADAAAFNNIQAQQINPNFNSIPQNPFFNVANGTASASQDIPGRNIGPTNAELNILSGGAPMSPTANSLLPSNLFALEDSPPSPKGSLSRAEEVPLRATPIEVLGFMAPQSPMSSGSVTTSHVSSPRSSLPLYPHLTTSDRSNSDLDRPANISSMANLRQFPPPVEEHQSGSRRFVKLFSSGNRGRKTYSLDGPILGSLKANESQSFPKNPDPPGLDPIGTRRRSGSYGSWISTPEFLAGRVQKPLERTNSDSSRRSAFNPFNPNFDPIEPNKFFDPPVSPRPSSIASFDNQLPAPSSDVSAAFGWPASEQMEIPRNRVSLLSTNWSDFTTGRVSQSRPVSRPISPNANASTASLSLLPSQLGGGFYAQQTYKPSTPRLNPAAPTFETSSFRSEENLSSHHRNKSKDTMSINTDVSHASTTGTSSGVSLESVPTKESILSRFSALSRKSSTSKFNISWKKDGFFGRNKKGDASDLEDIATGETPEGSVVAPSPLPWKEKGFFGRKKDQNVYASAPSEDEGADAEPPTPLVKESSPWLKSSQSGFFGTIGRKRPDKEKEKDKAKGKETEGEDEAEKWDVGTVKAGLGIWGRKKERDMRVSFDGGEKVDVEQE